VLALASDRPETRVQRGAILFLFLSSILATSEVDIPAGDQDDLKKISSDLDFIRFIALFYEIPDDIGLLNLSFHAVGTTSIIFKPKPRRHDRICALKIIQPTYVDNALIRSATERYEREYNLHTKHSPDIYRSSHTWILMEFIDGPN